jgi:hypothetical protein
MPETQQIFILILFYSRHFILNKLSSFKQNYIFFNHFLQKNYFTKNINMLKSKLYEHFLGPKTCIYVLCSIHTYIDINYRVE